MGRKKIAITRIQDERNRQITFSKRKSGLLKKAYELSILCDCEIAVIMITSNNKLHQYASSNMNSILIRYTEFKDPDESKTNADILDDIAKREKGALQHDDSGEEDEGGSHFLLTPRTQASYRRMDEEFDQILRRNQMPPAAQGIPTPLGSAPASMPSVMPVTVPVAAKYQGSAQQTIQQHLQHQMEQQQQQQQQQHHQRVMSSGSRSAGLSVGLPSGLSAILSAGPSSSSSSAASFLSPQSSSDLSASPSSTRSQKSPTNMPPPLNTPTRLQTLRNQTLKLHLPGSGRNYISLVSGGGGGSGGSGGGKKAGEGGEDGEAGEPGEDDDGKTTDGKPQLRVYIPGQKEFVPKTQTTSPLPHFAGQPPSTQPNTTTESLTTPILSLATPNVFSSLPPMFSSFMGEFPFIGGPPTSSGGATATGGDHSSSAALVAFPVSIQPSSGANANTGNIILQAQNMGHPFLLTPNYDARQNPLFASSGLTPPTTLGGMSPSLKDLEQLKQQYERTQQLIQQQLLISQMMQHHQTRDMIGANSTTAAPAPVTHAVPSSSSLQANSTHHQQQQASAVQDVDSGLGSHDGDDSQANRFINGSDIMIGSQGSRGRRLDSSEQGSSAKRPRLEATPPPPIATM